LDGNLLLTVGSVVPTAAILAASIVAYPGWITYGIFLLKRRKRVKNWGIVYDAQAKKPLPFATVRLLTFEDKKFIKEVITDLEGRYGLAVDPGKYYLQAESSEYQTMINPIEAKDKDAVIGEDFAMIKNTKLQMNNKTKVTIWLKRILGRLYNVLLITGFIFSVFALITNFSPINIAVVTLYVVQGSILFLFKNINKAGFVYNGETRARINGVFVRIFDSVENRQLDVQMTDDQGRYSFSLPAGTYLIRADAAGYKFPSSYQKNLTRSLSGMQFIKADIKTGGKITVAIALDPN
jgi:hypothetical protein